jgi:hypothetical protein
MLSTSRAAPDAAMAENAAVGDAPHHKSGREPFAIAFLPDLAFFFCRSG